MTKTATDNMRAARLEKLFNASLRGHRPVSTTQDAQLFLEAIRAKSSQSSCLETIFAHPSGLQAVSRSVRASSSADFISFHVLPLIAYFSHPDVKALCEGQLLQQLVAAIVEPPTTWKSMTKLYLEDGFVNAETSLQIFAWLCLEIATHAGTTLATPKDDLMTVVKERPFVGHSSPKIREFGYQIQRALDINVSPEGVSDVETAGGRHDNDFPDFRKISIYPTTDEFASTLRPFYRRAVEVANSDPGTRATIHLDNQFRLLREDMIAELREDIQSSIGRKRRKRPAQILGQIVPVGIDTGDDRRGQFCALLVRIGSGLEVLPNKSPEKRKAYLKDHVNILRHQAFGAMCCGDEIVGFGFIVRDIDKLAESTPVVGIQFSGSDTMAKVFIAAQSQRELRFMLVDTPVFAYEPVLERLKDIDRIPLENELLCRDSKDKGDLSSDFVPAKHLLGFVQRFCGASGDSKGVVVGHKRYDFDEAQMNALVNAIKRPLSVIQGPPGTGKSFIGAIVAKMLQERGSARLVVLAYTNHALDQFLEDLQNIGIDSNTMVRLGSKSSPATASLSFASQFRSCEIKRSKEANARLYRLKNEMMDLRNDIETAFQKYVGKVTWVDVLDHLEFSDDNQAQVFWSAFKVPSSDDGFAIAGQKGRKMTADYLIQRWQQGKGPGAFSGHVDASCQGVWKVPVKERMMHLGKWTNALRTEQSDNIRGLIHHFNEMQGQVEASFNEARCSFIKTKRLIGCTTTGAAKYASLIKAFKAECVLVEEAGEVMEAHVLTALSPATEQLILIGDHKQLRPKCKNYALSVEKGDGFDLNRSLFERLILQDHPYVTLRKQHRMHPEISQFVREMTYPDLLDSEKTSSRPQIRGICGRVAFINHESPEIVATEIQDGRDIEQKGSKQNLFEAEMILKIVRYLGQQGYKTSNIVVLTPYLGQLRLLRDLLSKDNDPLLNDLDSFELIRAGLLTNAAGKVDKGQIRLSTIDNYQGEESDIVIGSLTRSNGKGDIGFMKAPERLNVLVSRARNCLIMIGNMDTFMASPQGQDVWTPFFSMLKDKKYLEDGFWVRCEQHPERKMMLSTPEDFDKNCPDGGCSQLCGTKLTCGLHACQRRCHRLEDHSKVPCNQSIKKTCEKQHSYKVRCGGDHIGCDRCRKEEAEIRRRMARDLELEKARLARQAQYSRELQDIQDEKAHLERLVKEDREVEEETNTLQQYRKDLAALKETRARMAAMAEADKKNAQFSAAARKSTSAISKDADENLEMEPGSAKEEWEYLKRMELESSETLDALMDMIGLENVKKAFLNIKSTVDTVVRQNVSIKTERFGCTLLGNPGTGKTTVARLYAKFLTSMGVVAGSCFKETTGSKLASIGVPGCQAIIDDVLNEGGGFVFIDEAYQLSSGNSPGGRAVLDFLLAEVENLNSKICFVLAGYAKQMESFFAHNPGFPSRFPLEMKIEDYTDDELLRILELKINAKYGGRMKAEDGLRGLSCRIVTRRLGRGRGKEGFGNARAVENMLATVCRRQSERLRHERRAGMKSDDLLLTKDDLIGPEPSNALLESDAWNQLRGLIGLKSVKESVKSLVDSIGANYLRELNEEPIIEYSLNRVFLGNPGTGKTRVAKIYGQILVDLGMLSNGEVVIKNPSDFVGSALGQSEQQTKGILGATVGKVLVIDEAYGLCGGGGPQGGGVVDPYKAAVVDTIVAEVQSTPGDDRCVLLLGYKDQMEEMFQNANPGLSRRFPLSSAFVFEDFDQTELATIFDMKLKKQGFETTDKAKEVALDMLDRARNRPNFGNAGEIDILLNDAKMCHQKRLTAGATQRVSKLEALDFDENYNRLQDSSTNIAQLFKDTVGCDRIIATLQGYSETVRTMKILGLDPKENIPFNFLFRGPPGTGKSTTARKMGKVFYDAGFLASCEVIDCSASDLVGQYVGQTGPKVKQLLDKALGRVLLIDEAYRLAEGHFAKEALDELVDAVTKDKYYKRLIIILAGYEDDINRLLRVNPGLTSRFPEVIDFHSLDPAECFNLLVKKLAKQKVAVEKGGKGTLHLGCLVTPSVEFRGLVCTSFESLSVQSSWASARDVETLAKSMFQVAVSSVAGNSGAGITIDETVVSSVMEKMFNERHNRGKQASPSVPRLIESLSQTKGQPAGPVQQPSTTTKQNIELQRESKHEMITEDTTSALEETPYNPGPGPTNSRRKRAVRDAGVSDETWDQLQKDAEAEEQREREYQAKLKLKRETMDDELRRKILEELIEEEKQREKEAAAVAELEANGRCPVGYHWIRQAGGWRCAGGSHFVPEEELAG